MSTSYFFLQAEKNERNSSLLQALEDYATDRKQQIYVVNRPLGDSKYSYSYEDQVIILSPGTRIILLNYGIDLDAFEEFYEDFIEDLASISDKYRYKDLIGRSRQWKEIISKVASMPDTLNVAEFLAEHQILDPQERQRGELLISLLTGSINNVERVKLKVADNILDRVKQKIILFDGDQSRFIYQVPKQKQITIQGLSGTGKTELLMHKLRDIYTSDKESRIIFTCHNKILADSLRVRIPKFFNFMKVEEQIQWNDRLWCVNAWGSEGNRNSGAYSYICQHYGIPFRRYSETTKFDDACKSALISLNEIANEEIWEGEFAFDYMIIDESQDFPASFFELCSKVTKHNVYIAGDIFQSIFDSRIISEISPDFLLSKCYRTDPRTLMFAHALGMGLFESDKLRWLEEKEWEACGYNVRKDSDDRVYTLSREPLRRFEDLVEEGVSSVEIVKTRQDQNEDSVTKILEIISNIRQAYPTVQPNDIGIIFIDNDKSTYQRADRLEQAIPRDFGWKVNKAYETKENRADEVFISNRNNVKGLEFPFVICVTKVLNTTRSYRNALYMMLTRSFIRTYLLTSFDLNRTLIPKLEEGLQRINAEGTLTVDVPPVTEQMRIKTTFDYSVPNISQYDFVYRIFDELEIPVEARKKLYSIVNLAVGDQFNYQEVSQIIEFHYDRMMK